jgi:hypothetical protein
MEVQVASPMPRIDDAMATSSIMPIRSYPDGPTTLEVSSSSAGKTLAFPLVEKATPGQIPEDVATTSSDVRIPMGVALCLGDLEPSALVPTSLLAYADVATYGGVLAASALALPVFLANLQVVAMGFAFTCIFQWVLYLLIFFLSRLF